MRAGETLGLEIKHISEDFHTLEIDKLSQHVCEFRAEVYLPLAVLGFRCS
jgi:hypothetical protein